MLQMSCELDHCLKMIVSAKLS